MVTHNYVETSRVNGDEVMVKHIMESSLETKMRNRTI